MTLRLYDYWSSSAAYRVRIALNLKGLAYERVVVNRLSGAEEPGYLAVNPQGFVPTLKDGTLRILQSTAILEYLEEQYPAPALLPADLAGRARVRAIVGMIASDIQPLNNQRVQDALRDEWGFDKPALRCWCRRWLEDGLAAIERYLIETTSKGRFCHADAPTLADVLLVPQVYNARRWSADLSACPTVTSIEAACAEVPAFHAAHPERQADCPVPVPPPI